MGGRFLFIRTVDFMDDIARINAVLTVFERMGLEVRQVHLGGGGGGLCRVKGRRLVFVDLDADPASRLARNLEDLNSLPESRTIHLPPAIREALDRLEK